MSEATLKDLQPQFVAEPVFPYAKSSSRNMGSARLKLRRPSRLPSSSRKYMHGDPVHLIDWRAYARNDQLIIREQRDEASNQVLVCVDAGDTMLWPEQGLMDVPFKLELALRVGLHLTFAHLKKGDIVKMALWGEKQGEPQQVFHLRSASDVLRLFETIKSKGFGKEDLTGLLSDYQVRHHKYDQIYWLSDALRDEDFTWLFQHSRRLSMIHVLSSLEWNLDWLKGEVCYFDEQQGKKEYLGSTLLQGDRYQKRIQEWSLELKDLCQQKHGSYLLVTDQTTIREYLDQFFA